MRAVAAVVVMFAAGGGTVMASPCDVVVLRKIPARRVGASWTLSARDVVDVRFRVAFDTRVPDGLNLRYVTPNGRLYQETRVPVARAPQPRPRSFAGRRFGAPAAAVTAQRVGGRVRRIVETPPFAIAGTNISQSSIYGDWTLEVRGLTGDASCSRTFTIQP
jgi:hypothetical protein